MPLFQLLVLCLLSDQPTDTAVAARAARELFRSGLRTPHTILAADRGAVLRALARAHYRRYDESSATALVETAETVQEDYRGDLRLLAERSGRDTRSATTLLQGFSGIGDTGAKIFLREAQDVWPWARSTFDDRALEAARDLGLPGDATELGALSLGRNAELAAALVRYSDDADVRARLTD